MGSSISPPVQLLQREPDHVVALKFSPTYRVEDILKHIRGGKSAELGRREFQVLDSRSNAFVVDLHSRIRQYHIAIPSENQPLSSRALKLAVIYKHKSDTPGVEAFLASAMSAVLYTLMFQLNSSKRDIEILSKQLRSFRIRLLTDRKDLASLCCRLEGIAASALSHVQAEVVQNQIRTVKSIAETTHVDRLKQDTFRLLQCPRVVKGRMAQADELLKLASNGCDERLKNLVGIWVDSWETIIGVGYSAVWDEAKTRGFGWEPLF